MADKMLIDASHKEETRVVVVRGNRIEEFDFESQHKKQIRGNIYLAKVTRVEPSLQAAFVDYGGNRHGFLAFAEIHPDYYQIPLADRQALLQAEMEDQRKQSDNGDHDAEPAVDLSKAEQPDVGIVAQVEAALGSESEEAPSADVSLTEEPAAEPAEAEAVAAEAEKPKAKPRRTRARKKAAEPVAEDAATDAPAETIAETTVDAEDNSTPDSMAAMIETDAISEDVRGRGHDDDDDDDDDHEKEEIESVGAEDAMEEVPDRVYRKPRKQYRIQEVIKRRQILLVQVAKEERGNKGAALTTYLSLAGRYSVLMPNTARGGGISRKITQPTDRKRLKEIARELEVPQGMGVILRTAGANRTRVEIKRDFEYLMRLWENVRTLTLNSIAPCLVYEEGSLIKRSIRDLYNKDISEIIVAGEDGYREAKDFMKMLMPSHAKVVQPYRDLHPIFARSGIEAQLDRMLQPQVTLKSGGYLIINQTEALVAIDVNSGRSTREHSIEETALQTNLEAAEEVARQLRLRDLAGLIVIDFIDMEEKRNNRAVEKKLKDCLKNDRARIQVGRISHFGLLEMSRQRIRASVLESTTQVCSHCGGTGHVRSQSSVALHVLRGIEEYLLKNTTHDITVRTTPDIALYLLNHKRATVVDYEKRFGVSIFIESDGSLGSVHFAIDRGEPVANPIRIESLMQFAPVPDDDDDDIVDIVEDEEEEIEAAPAAAAPQESRSSDEENGNRKRKRRRRRRNRNRNGETSAQQNEDGDDTSDEEDDGEAESDEDNGVATAAGVSDQDGDAESEESQRRKRRRRGKRGGRRNRQGEDGFVAGGEGENGAEDDGDDEAGETSDAVATVDAEAPVAAVEDVVAEAVEADEAPAAEAKPVKPRRTRRGKASAAPEEVAAAEAPAEPVAEVAAPSASEEPVVEQAAAPQAETVAEEAGASETAAAEADTAAEEDRQVRANRASTITTSEPVVKSAVATDGDGTDPSKPKKAGWWQRRGFL
ncbi:Rne/Rng family ribonuclease [Rhizobium sp. SL86]|uniref:Rne/Rng family ribonuclease n=1 Tax=Rhizobium sp. SL86 TaxID=2995148 RepID=UPI0022732878|nr:ribonuclease E/G [Rhizobium sp. SL86]MCY1668380.1 ribonuclease E/G [Rhizobium sp. SL86]